LVLVGNVGGRECRSRRAVRELTACGEWGGGGDTMRIAIADCGIDGARSWNAVGFSLHEVRRANPQSEIHNHAMGAFRDRTSASRRPAASGPYGGRYVPETLMAALEELDRSARGAKRDPSFWTVLNALLKGTMWVGPRR